MMDPLLLLAFIPAALALNLTPGADMMFCFAQGLRGGPRPAMAASAGIAVGGMVHVTLAGLGLGALVISFPWLFSVIRWVGAAYLLWLAVRTRRTPLVTGTVPPRAAKRAFLDAALVNLSNPKVILFVLALLPQFVTPGAPVLPQFLILGGVLGLGGLVINGAVGVFASGFGRVLITNPRAERTLRYVSATLFGALAARIGWDALRP